MKHDIQILDKNTLLVYLINELSSNFNYEVDTILSPEGCWTGQINIRTTEKDSEQDIVNYYKNISKNT